MIDSPSSIASLHRPVSAALSCHTCQELLDDYASDTLTCEMSVASLEAHIIGCPDCQLCLEQADLFHETCLAMNQQLPQVQNTDSPSLVHEWLSQSFLALGLILASSLSFSLSGLYPLQPPSEPLHEVQLFATRSAVTRSLWPARPMLLQLDIQGLHLPVAYSIDLITQDGLRIKSISSATQPSISMHWGLPPGKFYARLYDPLTGSSYREYAIDVCLGS